MERARAGTKAVADRFLGGVMNNPDHPAGPDRAPRRSVAAGPDVPDTGGDGPSPVADNDVTEGVSGTVPREADVVASDGAPVGGDRLVGGLTGGG
jgi:hypothetical protein